MAITKSCSVLVSGNSFLMLHVLTMNSWICVVVRLRRGRIYGWQNSDWTRVPLKCFTLRRVALRFFVG